MDDWDRDHEQCKVSRYVDTSHNIPDGLAVKAVPRVVSRVPESRDRYADKRKQKAEGDPPCRQKHETDEKDFVQSSIRKYTPIQ